MARVDIHCQGFSGARAALNGTVQTMDVSVGRFLAASITLGFQRFRDLIDAGPRLWMHRLGQGLSGVSYLTEEHRRLFVTADHVALDGSEKGAMSYWQGMVFAKLAAAHVLGVRWLAHADAMERAGTLRRRGDAKGRADMAGRDDAGNWHVIEAKGYSSHPGLAALQAAKDQASVVEAINQQPPETTCACITRLWQSPINILLDDPAPSQGEKWAIPDDEFWEHYYGGLRDYIKANGKKQQLPSGHAFVFASLSPPLGILPAVARDGRWKRAEIGLPADLLADVSLAPAVLNRLFINGPLPDVGADGVAFVGGPSEWKDV